MRRRELVSVDAIIVGERRRKDLGDLTRLMKSLQEVGLIHPIVVTDDLALVAGARRLEATKRLGLTMIEVRRVGELTEQEENLHRKNLTPIERSETTVRLVIAVGELILWAKLFHEGKTTLSLAGLTAFFKPTPDG